MRTRADIECWLTDTDGVLVQEEHPLRGARQLLEQWQAPGGAGFLVLTNNSIFTPRDLSARRRASGLEMP